MDLLYHEMEWTELVANDILEPNDREDIFEDVDGQNNEAIAIQEEKKEITKEYIINCERIKRRKKENLKSYELTKTMIRKSEKKYKKKIITGQMKMEKDKIRN
jgi:hypothetical protein